ncbi:MAG: peptidase M14 [Gemmatimonadetes bacterium]|nr:peptidase M14 [Gemmatimonadota bacterium]
MLKLSQLHLLPILVLLSGCAAPAHNASPVGPGGPAAAFAERAAALTSPAELLRLHERVRIGAIETRRFTHQQYWSALEPIVDRSPHLQREVVGRSAEGRVLQAVRYGDGPTTVLLWSQMHGDESTASMSLLDLFNLLSISPDDPTARRIRERLTVVVLPLLNPDGAERFQRRNAQGIDVNRDARMLATPEGQTLRALQERYRPAFGFNLHDQNPRIRVGSTGRVAAISLLAPPFDEARSYNGVRENARRLAGLLRGTAEALVPQHVARYDDSFNPRAFGDLMQSWGTSTVLIEAGGWAGDPEKQHLRAVNFAMLINALEAIASNALTSANAAAYEDLPENGPLANDLLVRGGTIIVPGLPPLRADISANYNDSLRRDSASISDIGDLAEVVAIETVDVRGLFLHFSADGLRTTHAGPILSAGVPLSFVARRSADPASEVVMRVENGRSQR